MSRVQRLTVVLVLNLALVGGLVVAGVSIDRLATRTPPVHGLPVLVASGIATPSR
jgi:hypothetical protein